MKHLRKGFLALSVIVIFCSSVMAEEVAVTVKGLVCSFCAQGIKKTFSKRPDVADTKVDLEKKLVTLSLRDGSRITDDEIERSITDAGYSVIKIERLGGAQTPNTPTAERK